MSFHAVKSIRGKIDIDRVEKVMDDIEEEKALADELSEAITRPAQDMFDDEELLNELAELEELVEQEATSQSAKQLPIQTVRPVDIFANLPEVPKGPLPSQHIEESEEERALRELQASMM
jgi:charged multivesicular body protein 4